MQGGSPRVARVMIESSLPQLDRLFDYSIPEEFAAECVVGCRVRVPLRSAGRIADAYVIEISDAADYEGALSPLEAVVSSLPVLAPEVWTLARQVADRAAGAVSDIIRLAVPRRQVRVEKAWVAAGAVPAAAATAMIAAPEPGEYGEGRLCAVIAGRERVALAAVPRLVEVPGPDGTRHWVGHWAITLAALARQAVAAGESAILAVPDYRAQHQVMAALAAVVPEELIVRCDARQSNPDRYRSHLTALGADPRIIVGNRSAVYAPASRLGLIAIWDDGDPLHGEPLTPYVHARDVALMRQRQQDCALVLASHVRTAEAQRLVEIGWLTSLSSERLVLPRVVPTAVQETSEGFAANARIPSAAWRAAREGLESGPVLVQVARPGWAPKLACTTCGMGARCMSCGGLLAQRRSGAIPACTLCGALASAWRCGECGDHRMRTVGQGSQRTADELGRAFPGAKIVVSDGERPLERVPATPALVIATRGAEPVADGGYRAVLLLDGERMLARESLTVAEDCLRWWSNAVALSAPGAVSMLVGVGGELARAMATGQTVDFVHRELAERRALRFPPTVRVATITGSREPVDEAIAAVLAIEGVDVLGPTITDDGVRAVARFDYGAGSEVARTLKSEVIRAATNRRRRLPPGSSAGTALPRLRVRFDDPEPFL